MLFNSAAFIFLFLPVTLMAFFAAARFSRSLATSVLAVASLAFYGFWKPVFLPLLLISILVNFGIGEAILSARRSKLQEPRAHLWMMLGVAANLLALGWWKYAGLLTATLQAATGWPHHLLDIALPLGISFFTFTQIAYLIDAKRGLVPDENPVAGMPTRLGRLRRWVDRFTSYLLFVSYFPHLIAGPILHHSEMMPQFADRRTYRFSWDNIAIGLTLFGIGLVKKVILADSLAPQIAAGFDQLAQHQALGLYPGWLTLIAFSLQIYFDFSGYSDMAIGLSRLFGIHLPINFNSPYQATNIIEFWRRWHMTLSRFLRDYLYLPLGGNRKGAVRRYLNLMSVMLLGGLWHGAAWTFALWGGLHGLYLVANHLWQRRRADAQETDINWWSRLPWQMLTFIAVMLAWVPFRAPDIATALQLYGDLFGAHGGGQVSDAWSGLALLLVPMLMIAWFAPNSQQIMGHYLSQRMPAATQGPVHLPAANNAPRRSSARHWWHWQPNRWQGLAYSLAFASALYLVTFTHRITTFLYFQF
jgi:D-alanyl-lipoteichoic acid acyltransferase DltB (MBOAT superfamily)